MFSEKNLKNYLEQLIEAGHFLDSHGMVVEAVGNISARTDSSRVLISCRGTKLGNLQESDFALLALDGQKIKGEREPTSEKELHLIMYNARRDVGAVVHTHSPYATALAVIGDGIPLIVDEMTIILGGEVRLAKYAQPGTLEIAENALRGIEDRMGIIIANHGVVAVGEDVAEALKVAHLIEHLARIYLLAKQSGVVHKIPLEAYQHQRQIYLNRKEK